MPRNIIDQTINRPRTLHDGLHRSVDARKVRDIQLQHLERDMPLCPGVEQRVLTRKITQRCAHRETAFGERCTAVSRPCGARGDIR